MGKKGKSQEPEKPAAKPSRAYPSDEEYKEIEQATGFGQPEVNALFRLYVPYEERVSDDSGADTPKPDAFLAELSALCECPSIAVHPLIRRVLQLHNADKSGRISFPEFATALRALSVRSSLEQKLRFTFDLYDMNGSGVIHPPEMFELLRMMLGRAHDDRDLQAITDAYLKRFPGGFTFDIFCQMFDVSDLNKLTLNL